MFSQSAWEILGSSEAVLVDGVNGRSFASGSRFIFMFRER